MPVQKTANIGLQLPYSADHVDLNVINSNSTIIDETVGDIRNGLAIISDGNTHPKIPSGGWSIYVRNNASVPEGMYISVGPIPANYPLSIGPGGYNIVAEANGALNRLLDNDEHLAQRTQGLEMGLVELHHIRSNLPHIAISKGTIFELILVNDPDNFRADEYLLCRATRDIAANEPFDDPYDGSGNLELAINQLNALNSKVVKQVNLGHIDSNQTKTFTFPTGLSAGNFAPIGAALEFLGTYYPDIMKLEMVSSSGIQCNNTGGSGGDCVLWYALL